MKKKVLQGGRLLDGNGGKPIEDSVIVIEGSKFVAVGSRGKVQIPKGEDVEIIDTTGKTVLPGLIDTHIHCNLDGSVPDSFGEGPMKLNKMDMLLRAIPKIQAPYKMGITTIREGGSGWGWFEVALREGLKRGDVWGPRFQATGYHLTVTGGHSCFVPYNVGRLGIEEQGGMYCDGPTEWRRVARLNIWNGVDNVKLVTSRDLISTGDITISQPTYEEVWAAADEAKSAHKKVMVHASGREGIMKAIKAGVDVIVHGFYMDEECASMMAEQGIWWEPTNAYARNMRNCACNEVPEKFLKLFPNKLPKWAYENSIRNWEDRSQNFEKLLRTGVKVLMGSDGGCPHVIHGLNTMELEASVSIGQSTRDALLGCTKYAAEALGLADQLGTVEVGKLGDIVLVDGDPLSDISVLQEKEKILLVLREGEYVVDRRDGQEKVYQNC